MKNRNYLLLLTRLLCRRNWQSVILFKMIDMIVKDLIQRDDNTMSYEVLRKIYKYAKNCKSITELEDFLDKFQSSIYKLV